MSTIDASHGHGGPLSAFRHPNFRLLWWGQLLSLIGTWMQNLAQGWLIVVLADPSAAAHVMHGAGSAAAAVHHTSAAVQATANRYSGLVNFANGIPVLLLSLFAGVFIDRVNKRRLLIVTQLGQMACAAVLGLLIRLGVVQISHVMLLAFCVGLLMAFDMPTRQSFIVDLVGRNDLPSAVTLNSSMFNSARAIGPAIAGFLLAKGVSLSSCFFLNAASYLIVIASILLMRGKGLGEPAARPQTGAQAPKVLEELKEGLIYAWENHTTRNILLLVATLGTFAFSFNVLIPTFVRYSLLPHASSAYQVRSFGYLETVRGLGALGAAISVALLSKPERYKFMLVGGSLLSNILLMLFALERHMETAYVTMAVVTYGFILIFASANTVMQMTIPDNLRGRVMSLYTLVFVGTGPIGSLLAGLLAQYIGAPWTIFVFALTTLIIVGVICFRPGGLMTIQVVDMHAVPAAKPAGVNA